MRLYQVIGPRPVFEMQPGEQFERELTAGQEQALLGVHLRIVEPDQPDNEPGAPAGKPEPEPESEE